eukprot:CAMPEP_0119124176 /NCGR_PEP_ID=MMETSP1310-20130426/3868_1 /TAXON_ID=464262 /ORGANISM="Genus nov. species nov., Strain RCC2339" /LENGTH=442 /DNA_ID=CAMNT_0007114087 /DNA_START=139 /DNA_END=1467 /DNA_ORIENTATION=+
MADLLVEEGVDPAEQFELGEQLGEGSYGSVWKGRHVKSGKVVAIKRVPVEEEKDLREMMKEVDFMKGCISPYVIRYYGSARSKNGTDEELWIVMEYCGIGSVGDIMAICDEPLKENECATVCKYILQGLQYLNNRKMIHRDIKAGNVLLNDQGEGKLADFGVSGQITETQMKRNTVIGTPFWMAPEVIQEVGYDYKADIWSLGITAIELAECRPPYANIHPMRAIFMIPSRPPPKLSAPDKWSADFNDFIAKCLTKNPDERPSADDLLAHPFIAKSEGPSVLLPLIKKMYKVIEENYDGSRERALGLLDDSSDGEDDMSSGEELGPDTDCGTAKVIPSRSNDTAGFGTGPIDLHADDNSYTSGTFVKPGKDTASPAPAAISNSGRPAFLENLLQTHKTKQMFASHSVDELEQMVKDLEIEMEEAVVGIKKKYADRKAKYLDS